MRAFYVDTLGLVIRVAALNAIVAIFNPSVQVQHCGPARWRFASGRLEVQLDSALAIGPEVTVAAWDKHLHTGAVGVGLAVAPPQSALNREERWG